MFNPDPPIPELPDLKMLVPKEDGFSFKNASSSSFSSIVSGALVAISKPVLARAPERRPWSLVVVRNDVCRSARPSNDSLFHSDHESVGHSSRSGASEASDEFGDDYLKRLRERSMQQEVKEILYETKSQRSSKSMRSQGSDQSDDSKGSRKRPQKRDSSPDGRADVSGFKSKVKIKNRAFKNMLICFEEVVVFIVVLSLCRIFLCYRSTHPKVSSTSVFSSSPWSFRLRYHRLRFIEKNTPGFVAF